MSGAYGISLCVIARDEATYIRQCLRSAAPIVREAIVVDTGSTDGTAAIAAEEGAKVFSFIWNGNFAAARNFGLDQAAGDWILVLDADEMLEAVSRDAMEALLSAPEVEGYYVKIRSFLGEAADCVAEDHVVRLFRRKAAYRFAGAIHEQVAGSIKAQNGGGGLAFADLTISHFGYLNRQIEAKNKHDRNTGIIEHALTVTPDDPFLRYCLGVEHLQRGWYCEAERELKQALALMRGQEGYFRHAVMALATSLYKTGRFSELAAFAADCLTMFPGDADLYFFRGVAELAAGNYAAACQALERARDGAGEIMPPHWLDTLLGDAYNLAGRYTEAGAAYLAALGLNPRQLYPFYQLLGLQCRSAAAIDWHNLSGLGLTAVSLTPEAPEREHLAAVLTLLELLDVCRTGETGRLQTLVDQYQSVLDGSGLPDCGHWSAYLRLGAAEMAAYAGMYAAVGGCGLFSPLQAMRNLIIASLEALTGTAGPDWQPDPDYYLRGI